MIALALALVAPADDRPLVYLTGNQLYEQCQSPAPGRRCEGYVIGVLDTVTGLQSSGAIAPQICLSDNNVDSKQLVDIVAKFLHSHPERRHHSAASLVVPALREAFPCSTRKGL